MQKLCLVNFWRSRIISLVEMGQCLQARDEVRRRPEVLYTLCPQRGEDAAEHGHDVFVFHEDGQRGFGLPDDDLVGVEHEAGDEGEGALEDTRGAHLEFVVLFEFGSVGARSEEGIHVNVFAGTDTDPFEFGFPGNEADEGVGRTEEVDFVFGFVQYFEKDFIPLIFTFVNFYFSGSFALVVERE